MNDFLYLSDEIRFGHHKTSGLSISHVHHLPLGPPLGKVISLLHPARAPQCLDGMNHIGAIRRGLYLEAENPRAAKDVRHIVMKPNLGDEIRRASAASGLGPINIPAQP